jgi:hypothetical protein
MNFHKKSIKVDKDSNPIRDERGFCVRCEPEENGLIVGLISKSVNMAYNGYANQKEASEKKIIRNLFKPNQNAFNTGNKNYFFNNLKKKLNIVIDKVIY